MRVAISKYRYIYYIYNPTAHFSKATGPCPHVSPHSTTPCLKLLMYLLRNSRYRHEGTIPGGHRTRSMVASQRLFRIDEAWSLGDNGPKESHPWNNTTGNAAIGVGMQIGLDVSCHLAYFCNPDLGVFILTVHDSSCFWECLEYSNSSNGMFNLHFEGCFGCHSSRESCWIFPVIPHP